LFFDVAGCAGLSNVQKERILKHLAKRADRNGVVNVVSQRYRTQGANRIAAVERLKGLIEEALKERPMRKKTTIPKHIHRKRLEEKRRRSLLKKQRAERNPAEGYD